MTRELVISLNEMFAPSYYRIVETPGGRSVVMGDQRSAILTLLFGDKESEFEKEIADLTSRDDEGDEGRYLMVPPRTRRTFEREAIILERDSSFSLRLK